MTAIAAGLLTAIGIDARRLDGVSPFATSAVVPAVVVLAAVGAFVIAVYVLADESLTVYGLPASGAIVAACSGLVALVASERMRRAARASWIRPPSD